MSGKIKRFIVLVLADRDNYGYDEHTLPPLLAVMDSGSPDTRHSTHLCVIGFFLTSSRSLSRVQGVIRQAELLRSTDNRFASLGIGLAEGRMVADFTWLGRLKLNTLPLGDTANTAARSAQIPDGYRQPLQSLHEEFHRKA
jgi:hypothetical protein